MTSGIYKLTFAEGYEYIGKSANIEQRWEEHKQSFLRNKASAKMMYAYHKYGLPDFEIISRIHKDHIDILESFYIAKYRPILNSVISEPITNSEYKILVDNSDLLRLSTVEHIDTISSLKELNTSLEDSNQTLSKTIETLCMQRNKEEVESDCYENMQIEISLAEDRAKLLEEKNRLLQARVEYLELPWWKKLFR